MDAWWVVPSPCTPGGMRASFRCLLLLGAGHCGSRGEELPLSLGCLEAVARRDERTGRRGAVETWKQPSEARIHTR